MAVAAADVRAERTRILSTLLDRIELVIDRALETIRAEIPAYATQDERFFADVREQVGAHYRTKLACLMEDHDVRLEDISFARGAAMRRARAGFALEDYINAFRVGQQVFWEALVEAAGEGQSGHEAALGLATPVMRYVDFASTHAGHAYVEFHQHMVADADRERRDLLECLLAGDAPTHGPLAAAARAHGIGPGTPLLVAAAVAVSEPGDGDAPHAASAAIARSLLGDTRALVVIRQTEIVAVVALGPGTDPARVCERLHAVHVRLREEGLSLAAGVSTVAAGPAELPRAYQEARAALECVADHGGLAALPAPVAARLSRAAGRRHGAAARQPGCERVPGRGPRPRRPAGRDDPCLRGRRPAPARRRRAPADPPEHGPLPPALRAGALGARSAPRRGPDRAARGDGAGGRRQSLTRAPGTQPPGATLGW